MSSERPKGVVVCVLLYLRGQGQGQAGGGEGIRGEFAATFSKVDAIDIHTNYGVHIQ